MSSPVNSIIRAAIRPEDKPLNVLLFTTSEEYESLLCQTGHNFFALNLRQEFWNNSKAILPENYTQINQINNNVEFDCVLCLGRNHYLPQCLVLSRELHLPLIIMELEYADKNSSTKVRGDINLFVNDSQAESWKFKKGDYNLINNAIDQKLYSYNKDKKYTILTAVNNWQKRLSPTVMEFTGNFFKTLNYQLRY